MTPVPDTLETAIAQAKVATQAALAAGCDRLQVELLLPEITLQAQVLAREFAEIFADYGSGLKILFTDAGAAALARRDWGEVPFQISDLGSPRMPVTNKINEQDRAFLLVSPTAVEVEQVEKLCNLAGERPVLLLIPQLENVAIVGVGLAARQLRERFINTLDSCYYFRPLEGAAVLRAYPSPWQVWLERESGYELIAQEPQKPLGDKLELLISGASQAEASQGTAPRKKGLLSGLQQFLRALSQ
ncbi:MAG: DUF1995 family protein [Chloroflexaceae bacterium]|nr:DUF1995 family protein [Chloroflexaceae bacterium]